MERIEGDLYCTIFSIVPFEIREEKPGLFPPRYIIPKSIDNKPEFIHVATATHFVYLDETRGSLKVPTPSIIVAKSVVEDFITGQLAIDENSQPGLFWLPGKLGEKDLRELYGDLYQMAIAKQLTWMRAICRIADNDWNKYHQHNVVSDFQRSAAVIIGLDPEEHLWMNPNVKLETDRCKFCGTQIMVGIMKCPNCNEILDRERYAQERI